MALTTLLELVTRGCDELGLVRPTTVFGSSTYQDRQMLGLLNAAGRELMSMHQWSCLITTASVTLASASSNGYALPTDFDRLLDDAGWDQTNHFPMVGSISPQKHQFWLSSAVQAPSTRKEFRLNLQLSSNTFDIHPAPSSSDVLSFLYVRNTWVHSGSSYVSEFSADTDTTVFNPNLMVKELKWRFRAAKGLEASDLIAERDALYYRLVGADIAPPPLDMAGRLPQDPLDFLNIPETDWPIS